MIIVTNFMAGVCTGVAITLVLFFWGFSWKLFLGDDGHSRNKETKN